MATTTTRRLRAFKRWMRSQGIDYSDALDLIDHPEEGISVRTLCDLYEGDLVATIPKQSCLTIKNSGARRLIEVADLEGYLGLSVALMYEKSLGHQSPWFGYIQLLPQSESIPLLWSLEELDSMLSGTELNKVLATSGHYMTRPMTEHYVKNTIDEPPDLHASGYLWCYE